ncbi:MAG: HSP20 family protein [Psychroserpens sp.]|jgi:HSP20 family protein
MSLVKFRRRPFENLVGQGFFDNSNMISDMIPDTYWNLKSVGPALNIKESENNFDIELVAPGFDKKDFNVTIDNGCLKISAEKSSEKEENEENYARREFRYNSFERSLQLPESIKHDDIKAKYTDGILKFKLAKKEEAKEQPPKVIEID